MRKKLTRYFGVSLISYIVRNLLLPNPFESFGANGEIYNILAEPIIHAVAFLITGMFYEKNSFPALGSFLYLIFYCAIIFALWLLGLAKFAWWAILIACVAIAFIGFLIFMACQTREEYD